MAAAASRHEPRSHRQSTACSHLQATPTTTISRDPSPTSLTLHPQRRRVDLHARSRYPVPRHSMPSFVAAASREGLRRPCRPPRRRIISLRFSPHGGGPCDKAQAQAQAQCDKDQAQYDKAQIPPGALRVIAQLNFKTQACAGIYSPASFSSSILLLLLRSSDALVSSGGKEESEMDKKECAKVLVNRVRKVEPWMAVDIVDHFVCTNELPTVEFYSSGSDELIHSLIAETKKRMNVMSKAHSPGREFPALSRTSDGIQSPTPGGDHIVSSKIEAHSTPPAGQIVSSQIEENLRSSSVPGDGMPGFSNVTGCPPSSSEQLANIPCRFYMSTGVCKKGWSFRFSHGFGPLGKLEMAIRELLRNQPAIWVPVLPAIYFECYKQPLQGRWNQSTGSLRSLLMRLHTVTLIVDRMREDFVVLWEHAPSYLGPAVNLNVMDTGSGFNQIYITFTAEGRARCTESLVSNYFSQYGPVLKVRMSTPRLCGFVTFQYPQTVELLLFEWNPQVPHFICGATVLVKPYKHTGEAKPRNINIAERNGLQRGCDVGIVSGNSSVMIAPQMVPPLAQNPGSQAEREVNTPEGGDVTRPAHMSDGSDGHLARQDIEFSITEPLFLERSKSMQIWPCGLCTLVWNTNVTEKNELQSGCDVGIATENSSVTIAPQMAPPIAQNPGSNSEIEVKTPEGGDVTRPAHMSDGPDGQSTRRDMDDDIYHVSYSSLPGIDCFYEQPEPSAEQAQLLEQQFPADAIDE